VTKLFEALDIEHPYITYDHNNDEEDETFINQEERGQNNTEMTIVVDKTD